MPFVLVILGLLFLVVAIQGTHTTAWELIRSEFTGSNSFVVFAAAIVILGALGYLHPIRKIAWAMIGLVFLAMLLANKGFFQKLNDALRNPVRPSVSGGNDPTVGSGAGTIAPNAPTIFPGVPTTPLFYTPVRPAVAPLA